MNSVTVSISSNLPDGMQAISHAAAWLGSLLSELRTSATYCTMSHTTTYHNAVATGLCTHTALALDSLFKAFELSQGRDADARRRHVTPIDIDIVVWNGTVVRPWDFSQQFFQTGWQQLNTDAPAPAANTSAPCAKTHRL